MRNKNRFDDDFFVTDEDLKKARKKKPKSILSPAALRCRLDLNILSARLPSNKDEMAKFLARLSEEDMKTISKSAEIIYNILVRDKEI